MNGRPFILSIDTYNDDGSWRSGYSGPYTYFELVWFLLTGFKNMLLSGQKMHIQLELQEDWWKYRRGRALKEQWEADEKRQREIKEKFNGNRKKG